MSVQTYNYEAHLTWRWHGSFDAWNIPDEATMKNNLTHDFSTAFLSSFAAKMATTGHWYKMDNVTTLFTSYAGSWGVPAPLPPFFIDVEGETTIYFETDIKDATAHNSPQLWQDVQDVIESILDYLSAHPEVVVYIVAAGILVILAIWLVNTTTGAINSLGGSAGSLAITLGILAVAGLGIYALFFTKKGQRAQTKARKVYQRALPSRRS